MALPPQHPHVPASPPAAAATAKDGGGLAQFHAALTQVFGAGGKLARAHRDYQPRPAQLALAQAVAEALLGQRALLAEAGTGTGKTLAYLVPALLSQLKVVVSTATKQLQEQILTVEVPTVARALERPLNVVLMKGRTNYLCELRAEQALTRAAASSHPATAKLARDIFAWRASTQTGERSELHFLADEQKIWPELTATREQCLGRKCSLYDRCWLVRMRQRAQEADLVLVNHHLFFADLALGAADGGQGQPAATLLPPYEAVIFDEAHELDDIATQHFGHAVTDGELVALLAELAEHEQRQTRLPSLARARAHAQAALSALLASLPDAPRALLQTGTPDQLAARQQAHAQLDDAMAYMVAELASHNERSSQQLGLRLERWTQTLAQVLDVAPRPSLLAETPVAPQPPGGPAPFVRFAERLGPHRRLAARPIDVAAPMGRFFAELPAVFLSATLQVNGDFGHAAQRFGLAAPTTLAQPSDFDFARQASLYVAADLPEPKADARGEAAAMRAAALCAAAGGGAFVLCTSHRALGPMARALAPVCPLLLVQGQAPKAHLLKTFQAHTHAVLLATLGFWRGVDVPGPALRLVIMDRLPFAVPSDPLVAARLAQRAAAGQDPFATYQLPQAALLLRQGFGRLLRHHQDVGVVAILDSRLENRAYGATLLQALPPCPRLDSLAAAEALLMAQRPQPRA